MNLEPQSAMKVALVKLEMFFPYSHSLKEKRYALRKIKDRIFAEFKISVHEVSHQDKWQRTQLGFALVGNEAGLLNALVDKIGARIEEFGLGEMVDSVVEVISF
jgi:uncharacterized protein YlxP (DUF503 family)